MSQLPDTPSSSSNLRAIAQNFRLIGWISFWVQLALGVISGVILLANSLFGRNINNASSNAGTGFGILLEVGGLVALGIGIYLAYRYTRFGNQLQSSNPTNRPRKSETVQVLRLGLWVNLAGILLTLLGAQAIVGSFTLRALSQGQLIFSPQANQAIISGLDMFVVLANIQTLQAHFAGLVASLWLLNRVNRP